MADPAPSDREPSGRVASAIRESTTFGRFIAGLTAAQFQTLALAVMTMFMCSMTGWVVWKSQQSQLDREAQLSRFAESRDEVTRQHCDQREDKRSHEFNQRETAMRQWISQERNADREHYRQMDEKWRQTVSATIDEWRKWRDMLGPLLRKLPEEESSVSDPRLAPMPRFKVVVP